MEISLLSILGVAFLLGIKHAMEPDHVIAVSTVASHTKRLWTASLAGVFWGIGHTATLFIVGISVILMKNQIPEKWANSLEFLVGIMLVYLGITNLLHKKEKAHTHTDAGSADRHVETNVSYFKSMFIGLVHGLAGSAAMVLLTMPTVSSVWQGAAYILLFGAGTALGMFLISTIIGIPFALSEKNVVLHRGLAKITGLISTGFGLYYMYHLAITEGLFKSWML